MENKLEHENMLWSDDDSWAFPILVNNEENGVNVGFSDAQTTAPPPHPPSTAAAKGKKRSADGGGGSKSGGGGGESEDHGLHKWTARERRKRMRDMFANLHALIPYLPARADKYTIIDEAVNYIKKLQQIREKLQKLKEQRNPSNNPSFIIPQNEHLIISREAFLAEQGSTSKNVNASAITFANPQNTQNALFVSSPQFPAIFKTWASPNVILSVSGLDAHINICSPKKPGLLIAICVVLEKYKIDLISAQVSCDRGKCMYMIHANANVGCWKFPEAVALVEDIYMQAATEIMLWVNS